MSEKNNLILDMKNINKWFGDLHVIDDVSFQLKKGEKAVICGPSGSGKSTLVRCINGLETFESGEVDVVGSKISKDPHDNRKIQSKVGMLFQSFNLFPHMTILENCTLAPIIVKKKDKNEAIDYARYFLKRVKIEDQEGKFPVQLSGGQQQRAAIARALCMEPELLLFDEPTSALDPEMISEVLDAMLELAEEGMSMVCITHEMAFARKAADTIHFMADGKIIESAPTNQFFTKAKSPRLQQFLDQISAH